MKKLSILTVLLILCIMLTGCTKLLILGAVFAMGTYYYDSANDYGAWMIHNINIDFLPEAVGEYTVNGFSVLVYNYMDTCYEAFLDITVSQEQFTDLISAIKERGDYVERPAWYAEGYYEIVFNDEYTRHELPSDQNDGHEQVGTATIDKMIYNPKTLNIIYVSFHAHDTGVHDVEKVEYFNRFDITPEEYVDNLDTVSEESEETEEQ